MENQLLAQLIDDLCNASMEAYERLSDCFKNKVDLDHKPLNSLEMLRQAIDMLTSRAQKGNAPAMAILGNVYLKGWGGVTVDIPTALNYARRSASLGDPAGESLLGLFYMRGYKGGVVKDYNRAIYWFKMALDKGHSMGANNLGVMYEDGLGVKKDMNLALKYYRQAAAQNNSVAIKNIERLTNK